MTDYSILIKDYSMAFRGVCLFRETAMWPRAKLGALLSVQCKISIRFGV